jgi:toxin FitB
MQRCTARHTFGQPDLFIAATAAVHGLRVVTRNVVDSSPAGVALLNPWTGETIPARSSEGR